MVRVRTFLLFTPHDGYRFSYSNVEKKKLKTLFNVPNNSLVTPLSKTLKTKFSMALLRYNAFSTIRFLTLPTAHHFNVQKLNKRFAGERLHHHLPGPNVLPSTRRTRTRRHLGDVHQTNFRCISYLDFFVTKICRHLPILVKRG